MPQNGWDRKHLLALEGLSASNIHELLDRAEKLRDVALGKKKPKVDLAGQTVVNLFFEDSTRTRLSFTQAARRLGAETLEMTTAGSSVSKGESMVDTALNIQAMGVSAFVVRARASGAPAMIAKAVHVPVINAGDGRHEHPTQGLLDLFTMRQHLGDLNGKTIVIVGDIANSRVARSGVHGLTTLNANVILVGPPALVPKEFEQIASGPGTVSVQHDFDAVLPEADVVMMLRVQFERHDTDAPGIGVDYRERYGLTVERAKQLPEHTIVMHPGPINRGLELDSEVADDPKRSVILQQVSNGVAIRMAVLSTLTSAH